MLKRRMYKQEETEQIIHLVRQVREDHPRMSARDIYRKIQPTQLGRDQFEQICYNNGLRVKYRKNFRKTTDSTGVTRFPNYLKEIEVTGVNQVFVSDITYYEMGNRFYYLTFIMDLFNREIVGYSASDNMRTESTTLPALNMAIRLRGSENLKNTIIHSDGGGQYYSTDFISVTRENRMINSMAEEVFENPHAERLNGIIKNNYLYPYGPGDFKSLRKSLKRAVWMYNNEKPHSSLKGNTPINYIKNVEKKVNAI
jgi:transposase InsO family protein